MLTRTAGAPVETGEVDRAKWGDWLLAAAAAAVAVRLPFLGAPLSSDEAGFLLVGGQWWSGTGSLYGAYWVDRPPLLIAVFAVADLLGGTVALRLLGCLAAATSVVLAARLGGAIGGRASASGSAVAAAAFVSMPLFDSLQVSGELLACPFVLGGLLALVRAASSGATARPLLGVAGACGAAAVAVKQSMAHVFVAAVVLGALAVLAPRTRRAVPGAVVWLSAGTLAVVTVVVAGAAALGTAPGSLWYAVVEFRLAAAEVLDHPGNPADRRLLRYPGALLVSGAALLIVSLVTWSVRRLTTDPLAAVGLALLGWDAFVVVAGGSYWMHYLMGLVPMLVMASGLLLRDGGARARRARVAVGCAAVTSVVTLGALWLFPLDPLPHQVAGRWLREHRDPGDTAVVAYGKPNVLHEAEVTSPYPELWSLPVRVRDPHLSRFAGTLRGPDAPEWLLVGGELETWGIDPRSAERVVSRRYRLVAEVCGYEVYLRAGVRRDVEGGPAPDPCR